MILSSYLVSGAFSQSGVSGNNIVDSNVVATIACTPADKGDIGYYTLGLRTDTFYDTFTSTYESETLPPKKQMISDRLKKGAFVVCLIIFILIILLLASRDKKKKQNVDNRIHN